MQTNAINYYAPKIFTALGITGQSNSLLATGVYGIVKMSSCAIFITFLADTLGRRLSFVWTGFVMGFCMFYLGFYVRFDPPKTNAPIPPAGYVALVMVYIFAAAFQFGWGPGCWIYVSEIPTNRLRAYNVALAAATQWLFNLVVSQVTPVMLVSAGGPTGYGTYFIYGSFCFTMAVLAFWIPETKGVSHSWTGNDRSCVPLLTPVVLFRSRWSAWTNFLALRISLAWKTWVSRQRMPRRDGISKRFMSRLHGTDPALSISGSGFLILFLTLCGRHVVGR
jgi:hypothetical protein